MYKMKTRSLRYGIRPQARIEHRPSCPHLGEPGVALGQQLRAAQGEVLPDDLLEDGRRAVECSGWVSRRQSHRVTGSQGPPSPSPSILSSPLQGLQHGVLERALADVGVVPLALLVPLGRVEGGLQCTHREWEKANG